MTSGQIENKPYCPSCHRLLDGFTGMDHEARPKPGDVSVCLYCSEVLQFNDDLSFRLASPEAIEAAGLLQVSRAQRHARSFRALKKHHEKQTTESGSKKTGHR